MVGSRLAVFGGSAGLEGRGCGSGSGSGCGLDMCGGLISLVWCRGGGGLEGVFVA